MNNRGGSTGGGGASAPQIEGIKFLVPPGYSYIVQKLKETIEYTVPYIASLVVPGIWYSNIPGTISFHYYA